MPLYAPVFRYTNPSHSYIPAISIETLLTSAISSNGIGATPPFRIASTNAFAAAWFAGWLIVKYEHLHAHLSHDHVGSGPQKYHTESTPRIDGLAVTGISTSLNTNNGVAKYLWMPAIVTALLGVVAWQNTTALIASAISYCMLYVVAYRKIKRRKAMPVGARE